MRLIDIDPMFGIFMNVFDVVKKTGSELSELAIQSPSKYLSTLQQLKWIIDGKELTMDMLIDVQKGLLLAIPKPIKTPYKSELYSEELNQLLLRELGVYDR